MPTTDKDEINNLQEENKNLKIEVGLLKDGYFQLKETSKKLEESEEKFSKAFQTSSYAIMITRSKDGKILEINNTFYDVFGFTKKEALESSTIDLKLWVNIKDRNWVLSQIKGRGEVNKIEFQFKKKSGEHITGLFSAHTIHLGGEPYILSSISDISDRKKAEYLLSVSELQYRRLFETAKDGILLLDFKTGMILDVNHFLIELLGYSKESFLKKYLWEVGVFKDVAASKENFLTIQQKRYVRFEDLPLETRSGKKIDVEFVANAYMVDSTTIIQCNIRDITIRKQAEEQIKWLASFPTLNPMPVMEIDSKGEIVFINETTKKLFPDLKNKKMDHPFIAGVKNYFSKLNLTTKNTDTREIETEGHWYVQTIYLVSKERLRIYSTDITGRRLAEEELKENWKRFEKLTSNVPGLIFQFTRRSAGKYFVPIASEGIKDIFGCSPEDVINDFSPIAKVILPEDLDRVIKDIEHSAKYLSFFTCEYRVKIPDKPIKWIYSRLKPEKLPDGTITWFGFNTDITDHRLAEEKIKELMERDESILQSIGDAVFACDKEGKIVIFNKIAEELSGVTAKVAIGSHYKKILNFIGEKDGKGISDFIARAIETNKITTMANYTVLVRKDGSSMPIADSAAPIIDDNGVTIGCVVAFHDVTKERQIDKAKTEFVSLASHQLRTPLTALNWISETLVAGVGGELSPKQKKYMERITKSSRRMTTLVNTLLNVSRLDLGTLSIEPKSLIVEEIVKNCFKMLSREIAQKDITIKEKYDSDNPKLHADPKLLQIVLENILTNAIKYTPNGGHVNFTFKKNKNDYLFVVTDTGIGISKNDQDNIFKKLFRSDNARILDPEGSGLGLYIVKQIVDQSGGKIWFESKVGQGTTFNISWPLTGMVIHTGTKNLI